MKKYIPYILIGLLAVAIIAMFLTGDRSKQKKLNEAISLRKKDKIPYGTYVAYNSLQDLFSGSAVTTTRDEPGYWDEISSEKDGQLLIIVTDNLFANEDEMDELVNFVKRGNDVFISAVYLSSDAEKILRCNSSAYSLYNISGADLPKEPLLSLTNPPFRQEKLTYGYPGRSFKAYFEQTDRHTITTLGYSDKTKPDFVHAGIGKGNIFIHLEPLVFSNYFLLHKNNITYLENILSLVRPGVKTIAWDEYFINKERRPDTKRKGWFSVLLEYPGFKAGLLTALLALLVYALMEMRRKQRPIPVIKKPRNDSLDFVKTIGRLYYDKGDHKNLCRKMAAYFLEYVRSRYKLSTTALDKELVKGIHYKSGVPEAEISGIVDFIRGLDLAGTITSTQLISFYRQLESFYKKA